MRNVIETASNLSGETGSAQAPDQAGAVDQIEQQGESTFVHHRRTQRFLGRDTAYSRRPYGRM
jgi:hypothetical protein